MARIARPYSIVVAQYLAHRAIKLTNGGHCGMAVRACHWLEGEAVSYFSIFWPLTNLAVLQRPWSFPRLSLFGLRLVLSTLPISAWEIVRCFAARFNLAVLQRGYPIPQVKCSLPQFLQISVWLPVLQRVLFCSKIHTRCETAGYLPLVKPLLGSPVLAHDLVQPPILLYPCYHICTQPPPHAVVMC